MKTKTEQRLLEAIRAANDAGEGANDYEFISRSKGKYERWGRSQGEQKKPELAALNRLVERGEVEKRKGLYYIAEHQALAHTVADLPMLARRIEQVRLELAMAEERYANELAFAQRWVSK